jgi:AcrR family transcriptional regulator
MGKTISLDCLFCGEQAADMSAAPPAQDHGLRDMAALKGRTGPATNDQQRSQGGRGQQQRTQQQRARQTRHRLLDATVDCLVEFGWSGTTTTLIADRAGVSRGAQLHHYPTKAALVLAAVEHLAARRAAELRAEAAHLGAASPADRVARVLDLLAAAFTGPLFVAALELWVAARTDAELRRALEPLEAMLGRDMHQLAVQLLAADETQPGVRELVQITLDLLRGMGTASLLTDDSRRRDRLLATWRRQLTAHLG